MRPVQSILLLSSLGLVGCQAGSSYTLDLFSLLAFGLGITSVILALLAIVVSWELYRRSSESSELVKENVIKIESYVSGVRQDIQEIVQRAVGYWIGVDEGADPVADDDDIDLLHTIAEMQKRLDGLDGEYGQGAVDDLMELIRSQHEDIGQLRHELRNAKLRAIFPSAHEAPTAKTSKKSKTYRHKHVPLESTSCTAEGTVEVEVLSDSVNLGVGIDVDKKVLRGSKCSAELVSSESDYENEPSVRAGVPQRGKLNIHFVGLTKPGLYKVKYYVL